MERQLVDHLVAQQVVSRQDIQRCVLRASMSKGSVVEELITRAGADERALARAMAEHMGLRVHERPSIQAQPEALALVSSEKAEEFGVLAISYDETGGALELAVFDAERARPVIQDVRESTGISPVLVIAPRSTLEREIFRHYNHEHAADKTVAAPVDPPAMAKARIARPPRHIPGDAHEPATRVVHLDDSGPTRQVDLNVGEDNPFFDLMKNAQGSRPTASLTESTSPGPQPNDDFFDGFEDAFTDALDEHKFGVEKPARRETPTPPKPSSSPSIPAPSSSTSLRPPKPSPTPRSSGAGASSERDFGDMAGALSDFDAQLEAGDASSEAYEPQSATPPSATGFDRRSRTGSHSSRSSSGLIPLDPSQSSAPGFDSGESGLFPIDRQPFGFLDNDEPEEAENEPTLAQVVARQRQHLTRLEREVEYQKAILQSLAEMLVEARVLSRRKLKARLKELREKESKRST